MSLRSAGDFGGRCDCQRHDRAARADVSHLAGCLEALERQKDAPPIEVIVPHHQSIDGIEQLAQRFPQVVFLPLTGADASERRRQP